MKKLKLFIKKFIIITVLGILMFILGTSIITPSSASSEAVTQGKNSQLLQENFRLKEEYEKLNERLDEINSYINDIHAYDNVIYAEMLGVDFDTTGFYIYKNDSINFAIQSQDSIFSTLNDKTLYAAELLSIQLTKLQETSALFKTNKNAILYYPTISPIKTKDFINISSPFGYREHPIEKKILFHEGIDISANPGSGVYSTAQGKVIVILYSVYGYGNRVVIQHAYGFETLYAHLGDIKVHKGQWINKNQLIGTVGNSGTSTGPHLHYEVHKNGQPRDPLGYFYTNFGEELLALK